MIARTRKIRQLLASVMLAAGLALVAPVASPAQTEGWAGAPVFELPNLNRDLAAALGRLGRGDAAGAEAALAAIAERAPQAAAPQAALALAAAVQGAQDRAIEALGAAVARGFADAEALAASPAFAGLADDPRLAAVLATTPPELPAAAAAPAVVADRVVPVEPGNVQWRAETGLLDVLLRFTPPPPSQRGVVADPERGGDAGRLLDQLARRGAAAGHAGDLYDNRDRGHSRLDLALFPGLAATRYGEAAVAAGVDYGLNSALLFPGPVIGNSSTAVTGGQTWRSQARLALTATGGPQLSHTLWAANHLYVFPSHRDHDSQWGDLFPANTPYMLVSQGSSRSDQPLLRAAAAVYAAFRPDTKAFLVERGLLAATTQMVIRRTLAGIEDDDAYMTGRAHPSVFRAEDLRPVEAIGLANRLTVDAVPPVVQLALVEEAPGQGWAEVFADDLGERLFDTPAAIARVFHGVSGARRYVLDAGATADPNGRPLRIHWRLLRGDPARVRIRPLDDSGQRVEIIVLWHDPLPVPERPELTSHRVDIGAFADNGAALSVPSFFSVSFPPGQTRLYRDDGMPLSIDFGPGDTYADPLLFPRRNWRDVFLYADTGALIGWERHRGEDVTRFSRHGARVLEVDASGRPVRAELVRYPRGLQNDRQVVTEMPTGEIILYRYAGPEDRVGTAERAPPSP